MGAVRTRGLKTPVVDDPEADRPVRLEIAAATVNALTVGRRQVRAPARKSGDDDDELISLDMPIDRLASERTPASPCIGTCLLDPATGYCRGCLRSVAEIATWYEASASAKRASLARVAGRRRLDNGPAAESSE